MQSIRGRFAVNRQQQCNSRSTRRIIIEFRTPSVRAGRRIWAGSATLHPDGVEHAQGLERLPFRHTNLQIDRGTWSVQRSKHAIKLQGTVRITSLKPGQELFIPEIVPRLQCIGDASSSLSHSITVAKRSPGPGAAPEASRHRSSVEKYWSVPIIRHNEITEVLVEAEISGSGASKLKAAWIELNVDVYGPHGCETERQDIVLPLEAVEPIQQDALQWQECPYATNVKTVSVIRTYVSHLACADHRDIVCIAESALAIMQGRWLHYKAVKPSWIARLGCRLFDPLSSMASACGLQAAIYLVGRIRVVLGLVVGVISRLLGIRGMFYRTVGAQATAIDDLTGTLPPFDRFLVYGPVQCDQVVQDVEKETGMRCAVVDVNDKSAATGGLKVLAASAGVEIGILMSALKHNPAGNAAEQTPIVLVRGIP